MFATSPFTVSSERSPTVAGVALELIGWRVVWLYHHVNTGGSLIIFWEFRKWDFSHHPITPSTTPATARNRIGRKIHYSGWSRLHLHRCSLVTDLGIENRRQLG